ncbi:beta strand repeat-containing protein [Gemmatimonas phototrophica]|uniref:BIG2 domain-containing protein n=1 Tax=Gemmatimonas phototrophica TaxID=1379270 RepID=A0A143BI56_9BACT|nr:Ig-like domain-containing protein [Gemmatimonas phototrophica]AMW04303.1 hypothetical protein GEMMAAP_04530 [Gemmatimonas phototrophica]
MQLFSRNKALSVLSLGALAALGACGDDVTVPAPVNPPVVVTISPSNANVNVGASVDLAVAITGGTTTPTLTGCATSSAAVATAAVQGGTACRVTGVSTGSVSITATTSGGQTAAASVTVNAPVAAISGIAITPAAANLQVGGTTTITANPTTTAPGAVVARAYVSSNTAVATVTSAGVVTAVAPGQATITVSLTGTGTGLSTANVTGQVAITVTALPPSVTGVTATPTSATLITAGTQQITATATYAAGNTGTITYGTNAPGVATVNASGLITAVGPGAAIITVTASSAGNASFGAASATAQIPVTVNAPAQVSIANITEGTTNNPVNINNVAGQIQVQLNLVTNNNNVSSVSLYVCDAAVNCTMTASPAAQQNFGTAGAANGQINLFINTADFTTDFATATAKFLNGQKNLIAVLNVANSNANSNLAILNFNNTDGFAAKHTAPTRSAVNASSNTTFFGGPDAAGRGRIQIAPVIYTAGRSLVSVTAGLTGVCGGTITFNSTNAFPIDYTYGYATTGNNITCGSESNPNADPDVTARVVASIDNAQNAGPSASMASSFRTTTSSIPAVTAPAIIRVDYDTPSIDYAFGSELLAPTGGELGWVNAAYSFATGDIDDNGVGPRANSTIVYGFAGCGTSTYTTFTTNTGADIAECTTDFTGGLVSGVNTRGPYTARATGQDLLSNESSATTDNFGVDKTNPALRYTASSDSLTIYNGTVPTVGTAADTMFSSEALDERAGFASTAAVHMLSRANQALNAGSCVVGTGTIGSAFVTAPGCTMAAAAFTGTVLVDGYKPIAPVTYSFLAGAEGYWTYRVRVTDRAGNMTTREYRYALINTSTPTMTGMGIPSTITAAGTNTFTPNFTEIVESRLNSFRVVYGAGDTLTFPATATYSLWDDVIGSNGNTTMGKPFTSGVTFYTNIQTTTSTNTIGDTASTRPDSALAAVTNVGGIGSAFFGVALLNANIQNDATAWTTSTTGKGSLVDSFFVAASAAAWNSPAGGVKARVFANTNIINSPFTRIDFYYRAAPATPFQYAGTVDATVTPALSPVAGAPVYIADNGTQRVWTYVLRSVANTNTSLTALVGGYTNPLGTIATGCWRAIATSSSNGRVLSTQNVDLAGGAACVTP